MFYQCTSKSWKVYNVLVKEIFYRLLNFFLFFPKLDDELSCSHIVNQEQLLARFYVIVLLNDLIFEENVQILFILFHNIVNDLMTIAMIAVTFIFIFNTTFISLARSEFKNFVHEHFPISVELLVLFNDVA